MTTIWHAATRSRWEAATAGGAYEGGPDDERDGFIHFSPGEKVAETLAIHRRGVTDLVLLEVDAGALGSALRWEPARGGTLFPHLYGALPVAAVRAVHDLPLDEDGVHRLPPALGGRP